MAQNSEIQSKVVETYAEDMAGVIQGDNTGLIKKIIHGEEEKEALERSQSPEAKKDKILMIVSIILMLLALATLAFFYFRQDKSIIIPPPQFLPIVFTDKNSFLEVAGLKKEAMAQTVLVETKSSTVKAGGVEGIYLTENKQTIGLRKFISLIKGNFAPAADPTLVSDDFMMGIVNGVDSKDFFILLKMRSTLDIFTSLRTWENKMFEDLAPFFGTEIDSSNNYLLTKNFEDGIIENKNARILYEDGDPGNEKMALMYIFADDNSVIITDSLTAAREIMLRLASSQLKK